MGRSSVACDKCRVLKVRCIRSEDGQPCRKCAKSGLQCVTSKTKRTTGNPHRNRSRIADLDSKLNGILDLLSRPDTVAGTNDLNASSAARQENPTDISPIQPSKLFKANNLDPPSNVSTCPATHSTSITTVGSDVDIEPDGGRITTTAVDPDPVSYLNLSQNVLEHLLNEFRSRQAFYPFVVVSPEWTVRSMIAERPFLFLATITNASSRYPQLQQSLVSTFKETLARRVIVAGDRDLDVLQGILVHLAWFHFYWVPRSPQMYSLLQIAVSIVVDLGLDRLPEDVLEERPDLLLQDPSLRSNRSSLDQYFSTEARRAALGCLHLSAVISVAAAKPNTLPMTEYMLNIAQKLQRDPEFKTDQLIYPLAQLQTLLAEVRDLYRVEKSPNGRLRLHTHADRLIKHLDLWYSSLSLDFRGLALFKHGYHSAKIRILEMGLVYRFAPGRPFAFTSAEDRNTIATAHPVLIANLIRCTDAAREYLDCFLTIQMNDYHILPLEEWLSAILAPFVLYRLCVGLREVPEWTFETARETVDFEFYLDQILDRLKGIWADNPLAYTLNSDNLYALLPQIFENVKESFIAARDGFCESSDGLRGHQDLGASQQGPTASCSHARRTPREQRVRCPATTGLPTDTSPNFWSTPRDMTAPSDGLGFEIQDLENDKFWIDLMSDEFMMKTPYNF